MTSFIRIENSNEQDQFFTELLISIGIARETSKKLNIDPEVQKILARLDVYLRLNTSMENQHCLTASREVLNKYKEVAQC